MSTWQESVKSVMAELNKSTDPNNTPSLMIWGGYMYYRDGRTPTGMNGETLSDEELQEARTELDKFARMITPQHPEPPASP